MNRQFRRAQEKQDKKQEREKSKRRDARRARVTQLRKERRERAEARKASSAPAPASPGGRRRMPGRFSGVLAGVTVFFIALQGAAPTEQDDGVGASLIAAGFYLMLGYFATLWLMRRETDRAPVLSVVGGLLLAASVTVAGVLQGRSLDPIELALVLPALVIGALLGRLVFVASPR